MTALLWFRRDLRLHDHPALRAALATGEPLVPVFCLDPTLLHGRHESGNRTRFLLESLADLDRALRGRGSGLVLRHGDPALELRDLARHTGASTVHVTADAGPFARARDARVADALGEAGASLCAHPGLFAVDGLAEIRTGKGAPYTVFSPFHRSWSRARRRDVLGVPRSLPRLPEVLERGGIPALRELGLSADALDPLPGGETAGRSRMTAFLRGPVEAYAEGHDAPAEQGTSRLSPYLHFGCVSARELEERARSGPGADGAGSQAWIRQLCWRDFYAHVLLHFPGNARQEHQERFRGSLRWSRAEKRFEAWCEGRSGYPLVDAGMRQLRAEGWMHNRARLVVGSFLTKDLAIDWRWGERWFMRLLVDGDEANNNGNWQWIASVGVDPQPPFKRIFNPARQQERFDPAGKYVRRWLPELSEVPRQYLAEPWTMPADLQRSSGCVLGQDYPDPIVDHAVARRQALERYALAGSGHGRAD